MINVNYYEQIEWNEDKIYKVTVSDPPTMGGMLSITQEYDMLGISSASSWFAFVHAHSFLNITMSFIRTAWRQISGLVPSRGHVLAHTRPIINTGTMEVMHYLDKKVKGYRKLAWMGPAGLFLSSYDRKLKFSSDMSDLFHSEIKWKLFFPHIVLCLRCME